MVPPNREWRERLKALGNVPLVFRLVWGAGAWLVSASMASRLLSALIPLAILAVSRRIIDGVVAVSARGQPLPDGFWWLVVVELCLAGAAAILLRAVVF